MQIEGKTVLITGAGRGLGAAMARRFAELGADLALVDLDAAGLDAVAQACRALGCRAETYSASVADEAITAALDRVVRLWRLDCTIANAAFCATACS
jgi:NAD(P)-dependent dehydrogenase (short-subunit alcohol dehydrogenase family)